MTPSIILFGWVTLAMMLAASFCTWRTRMKSQPEHDPWAEPASDPVPMPPRLYVIRDGRVEVLRGTLN